MRHVLIGIANFILIPLGMMVLIVGGIFYLLTTIIYYPATKYPQLHKLCYWVSCPTRWLSDQAIRLLNLITKGINGYY